MTHSGKLFADELTNWLIDKVGFNQQKRQMSVYCKYSADGSKLVGLSYVDNCLYWYTFEELGKWFWDTLEKRFHVNFIGYVPWFMSISISQLKNNYISQEQNRYATSVVANYQDTATIKENSKCHKTTLPQYMIFTK